MKYLIFFVLALMTMGSSAQISGGVNDGLNYGFTLIPIKEKQLELEGSEYYHNNFIQGTVDIEGKKPAQVYLRYNVADERMEIKTHPESSKIYQLPGDNDVSYVINSERFILDKITSNGKEFYGFFVELYKGDKTRLVKKPIAHFREGEKAKTGYGKDTPSRITIENEFFIIRNGEILSVQPRSKDVKKAFKTTKAQEYLKNNRIKNEGDLISFVSFLDI